MSRRSHGYGRRAAILVGVLLVSTPAKVLAQELANPGGLDDVAPNVALSLAEAGLQPALTAQPPNQPARSISDAKRGALLPLYVSYALLQGLDVQSTRTALGGGGREANPLMTGLADRPVAFVALKAATGVAVILASEKMRARNKVAALVTMAALNGLYATIVTHNYSVAGR
jgi:hypothetical protein